jgi:hypothetical protein
MCQMNKQPIEQKSRVAAAFVGRNKRSPSRRIDADLSQSYGHRLRIWLI